MTDNKPAETLIQYADGAIAKTQHAVDAADAFLRSGVDSAQHASAKTVHYIQEEPIKAVLIAAATGAVLMALVSMVSRAPVRA